MFLIIIFINFCVLFDIAVFVTCSKTFDAVFCFATVVTKRANKVHVLHVSESYPLINCDMVLPMY